MQATAPARAQVEEQEALASNASMDSVNFEAEGIPEGFRRLHSPRQGKPPAEATLARVQAQLEALPMQYADAYEGHLTDLRTLLETDIWADVQARARPPRALCHRASLLCHAQHATWRAACAAIDTSALCCTFLQHEALKHLPGLRT